MPVSNTTVESVSQRVVQTRDGRSSTVFEIVDGRGTKWQTFKQPIANEANRLIGMAVEINGRTEQNGQWTNHYIDDIRQATGAVQRETFAPAQAAQQAQQAQPPAQRDEPQSYGTEHAKPAGSDWNEKDWSIMRQCAGKVAGQISGNDPKDFWSNVGPLLTYFAYGLVPPEYDPVRQQATQPPPQQQSQRYVPENVPTQEQAWTPGGNDDDIPF